MLRDPAFRDIFNSIVKDSGAVAASMEPTMCRGDDVNQPLSFEELERLLSDPNVLDSIARDPELGLAASIDYLPAPAACQSTSCSLWPACPPNSPGAHARQTPVAAPATGPIATGGAAQIAGAWSSPSNPSASNAASRLPMDVLLAAEQNQGAQNHAAAAAARTTRKRTFGEGVAEEEEDDNDHDGGDSDDDGTLEEELEASVCEPPALDPPLPCQGIGDVRARLHPAVSHPPVPWDSTLTAANVPSFASTGAGAGAAAAASATPAKRARLQGDARAKGKPVRQSANRKRDKIQCAALTAALLGSMAADAVRRFLAEHRRTLATPWARLSDFVSLLSQKPDLQWHPRFPLGLHWGEKLCQDEREALQHSMEPGNLCSSLHNAENNRCKRSLWALDAVAAELTRFITAHDDERCPHCAAAPHDTAAATFEEMPTSLLHCICRHLQQCRDALRGGGGNFGAWLAVLCNKIAALAAQNSAPLLASAADQQQMKIRPETLKATKSGHHAWRQRASSHTLMGT